jgi:hypothetical protein
MKVLIHQERINAQNLGTAKDVLEGIWDTLIPGRVYEYCYNNNLEIQIKTQEDLKHGLVFIDFYAVCTEQQGTYLNLLK